MDHLGSRMREEWDRRVSHDYRYWMSDGVASDAEMWRVGQRDFAILSRGIEPRGVAFELGCGVGRLLRAASSNFDKVIGLDVSEKAVSEAKRLLSDVDNVELILGNGRDCQPVEDESVDFAYSFAALSSMPVKVIVDYLLELSRILRTDGVCRLQVYLGKSQQTNEADTLAIRSFEQGRFIAAAKEAGLSLQSIEELVLPFEISDREAGQVAKIVSLVKKHPATLDANTIAEILLPSGETPETGEWPGSETEYLMALARAEQHMNKGEQAQAKEALEYAMKHYRLAEDVVTSMLERLGESEATPPVTLPKMGPPTSSGSHFEMNLRVLRERFPKVALAVEGVTQRLEVRDSEENTPVIFFEGKPLDNISKPKRAAEVWVERVRNNAVVAEAEELIVFGFAGAHHLKALDRALHKPMHVVEPRASVLREALEQFDLRELLSRLESLRLSTQDIEDLPITTAELLLHPQSKLVERESADQLKRHFWSIRGALELNPSFGVVGPIYGGSLPVAENVVRGLANLGARVEYFNFQEFCGAYTQLKRFLRDPHRLASVEEQYVEMLSKLLVEAVSERPVDILICLAQAPLSPTALTELRERGVTTAMWFVEDCRRFTAWQQISRYYDYMFLIQKDNYLKVVEQAGAGRAIYLPLACDPALHRPVALSEEEKTRWGSAVSFVGAGYNNRQQVFATLGNYDFKIWGTEWPDCAPFNRLLQEKGRRIKPEEYVKIFNSSAVNLNLHSSSERDGVDPTGDFVNPRTFELAASGAFQLCDERAYLAELFEPGREITTFRNRNELIEKIDYYLAHPEERSAIAERCRARALSEHTYEKRLQEMLGHIYADRFDELRKRAKQSPWPRALKVAEKFPELHKRMESIRNHGLPPDIDSLAGEIQAGKGQLSEVEERILFLFHLKKQIRYINDLKSGKEQA